MPCVTDFLIEPCEMGPRGGVRNWKMAQQEVSSGMSSITGSVSRSNNDGGSAQVSLQYNAVADQSLYLGEDLVVF